MAYYTLSRKTYRDDVHGGGLIASSESSRFYSLSEANDELNAAVVDAVMSHHTVTYLGGEFRAEHPSWGNSKAVTVTYLRIISRDGEPQ